jgi:hypothetical protein
MVIYITFQSTTEPYHPPKYNKILTQLELVLVFDIFITK